MHITLTGNLGSGKSTICKALEKDYGFEIYSTGKVQRTLAEELGISVLEMNQLMCKYHKYDKMIDDTTAKISRENPDKNIVFDSRLAWHFVEKSFKVFLTVSLDVAARRVYEDNRGAVEKYSSIEDAKEQLRLRAETEDVRYKDLYQIEYFNFSNYNLVLDSTCCSPDVLASLLISEAKKYYENQNEKERTVILMSPKRLGYVEAYADIENKTIVAEGIVHVKKTAHDYEVVEGMDIVTKAGKGNIPFVRVEIN